MRFFSRTHSISLCLRFIETRFYSLFIAGSFISTNDTTPESGNDWVDEESTVSTTPRKAAKLYKAKRRTTKSMTQTTLATEAAVTTIDTATGTTVVSSSQGRIGNSIPRSEAPQIDTELTTDVSGPVKIEGITNSPVAQPTVAVPTKAASFLPDFLKNVWTQPSARVATSTTTESTDEMTVSDPPGSATTPRKVATLYKAKKKTTKARTAATIAERTLTTYAGTTRSGLLANSLKNVWTQPPIPVATTTPDRVTEDLVTDGSSGAEEDDARAATVVTEDQPFDTTPRALATMYKPKRRTTKPRSTLTTKSNRIEGTTKSGFLPRILDHVLGTTTTRTQPRLVNPFAANEKEYGEDTVDEAGQESLRIKEKSEEKSTPSIDLKSDLWTRLGSAVQRTTTSPASDNDRENMTDEPNRSTRLKPRKMSTTHRRKGAQKSTRKVPNTTLFSNIFSRDNENSGAPDKSESVTKRLPFFGDFFASFQSAYLPYHGALSLSACSVGIVLNAVSISVLAEQPMRAMPVNVLLLTSAVSDVMSILSYLPFAWHQFKSGSPMNFIEGTDFASINFIGISLNFYAIWHSTSVFLTMKQAVSRHIEVKIPAKKYLCTRNRAMLGSMMSFIASACLFFPKFFGFEVSKIGDHLLEKVAGEIEDGGVVDQIGAGISAVGSKIGSFNLKEEINLGIDAVYRLVDSEFLNKHAEFLRPAAAWLLSFAKLLPCSVVSWLGIPLAMAENIVPSTEEESDQGLKNPLAGFSPRENGFSKAQLEARAFQLTKTLVTIFGFFVASELPSGTMAALSSLSKDLATFVYDPLRELLDLIILVNKSVRFMACSTMYPDFRETLCRKFLPPALQPASIKAVLQRPMGNGGANL